MVVESFVANNRAKSTIKGHGYRWNEPAFVKDVLWLANAKDAKPREILEKLNVLAPGQGYKLIPEKNGVIRAWQEVRDRRPRERLKLTKPAQKYLRSQLEALAHQKKLR